MLDTPARGRALSPQDGGTRRGPGSPSLRRDLPEDFSAGQRRRVPGWDDDPEDASPATKKDRRGLRLRLGRSVPKSVVGRVSAGVALLACVGLVVFALVKARAAMLHDARMIVPSSRAIQISGNNHLTKAQLLSVFGDDVDRNIMTVPLAQRRAELEALPWVEHATVMRLLPNTVRVSITERTPVAFVRQGGTIGLVDAHGVLLDLAPEVAADHAYSFPVVTGLAEADPLDTRAARIKVYQRFTSDLDSGPEKITGKLSEIDLTDPEDVKALIPDGATDVLVHFGEDDFLERYHRYMQNLPDWKVKYPKLSSADMRYDREVVLEMTPGAAVPVSGTASADGHATVGAPAASSAKAAVVAQKLAPGKKPPVAKTPAAKSSVLAKSSSKAPGKAASKAAAKPVVIRPHLQQAFDAHKGVKTGHAAPVRGPR